MNLKRPNKDYLFVIVQLLLFISYSLQLNLFNIKLPEWLCYSGLFIAVVSALFGMMAILQLNTKLSPFPSPVIYGRLITNGAFRMSRHPIYTAIIFLGLGYAIYTSSIYKALITLMLFVLFYFKSKYEEKLLHLKFSEYQDYKKRTRRFL